MRNLLIGILMFLSINIYSQGNSPKEVFQLLEKAYKTKDTMAVRSLYYQNSSDDQRIVTINIKLFLMKPELIAFKDRIIKTYHEGALKNQMLGLLIGIGTLPYYFKEKSDSAEIIIADNKATSLYKDPSGLNPIDYFIKVNNRWYLDPKDGKADANIEGSEKFLALFEIILKEGNKLMDNKVSKEVFNDKLTHIIKQ